MVSLNHSPTARERQAGGGMEEGEGRRKGRERDGGWRSPENSFARLGIIPSEVVKNPGSKFMTFIYFVYHSCE